MTKKLFSQDDINRISASIRTLPPLKNNLSLKKLVKSLSNDIKNLRKNGYTWEGIITILEKDGVKISKLTLKNYMSHRSVLPKKASNVSKKTIRFTTTNGLGRMQETSEEDFLQQLIDEKNI
jgi:phosphosulfolactate phosphohydrolase-like enzyme